MIKDFILETFGKNVGVLIYDILNIMAASAIFSYVYVASSRAGRYFGESQDNQI